MQPTLVWATLLHWALLCSHFTRFWPLAPSVLLPLCHSFLIQAVGKLLFFYACPSESSCFIFFFCSNLVCVFFFSLFRNSSLLSELQPSLYSLWFSFYALLFPFLLFCLSVKLSNLVCFSSVFTFSWFPWHDACYICFALFVFLLSVFPPTTLFLLKSATNWWFCVWFQSHSPFVSLYFLRASLRLPFLPEGCHWSAI